MRQEEGWDWLKKIVLDDILARARARARAHDRGRQPGRDMGRSGPRGEPSNMGRRGALRPAGARRRAPRADGVTCLPRCCRRLRVLGALWWCAGGDPNAHRARTHGVMCRTHAARALSHTQRAHGGCFVHALFCTLWQVLTTDATFVTNPARVLGGHSAPAVVRCARCVSPTPRFASPPMRTGTAPLDSALGKSFTTRQIHKFSLSVGNASARE